MARGLRPCLTTSTVWKPRRELWLLQVNYNVYSAYQNPHVCTAARTIKVRSRLLKVTQCSSSPGYPPFNSTLEHFIAMISRECERCRARRSHRFWWTLLRGGNSNQNSSPTFDRNLKSIVLPRLSSPRNPLEFINGRKLKLKKEEKFGRQKDTFI